LLIIQADKNTLPKSNLGKAVNYALNEHEALCNYLKDADYRLDNNDMERINRYISLSRKNSLFSGSHEGAERTALIYSLACSCRLHGINSFEYFVSLINKMAGLPPNPPKEIIRELLPDRWQK
jgi:predicted solute-binding protein